MSFIAVLNPPRRNPLESSSMTPPLSCRNWIGCLLGLALSAATPDSRAHGRVMLEGDVCVIEIGVFQAHFTLYQPRERQHEEFCEELPEAGETLFVMEYISTALAGAPLDLRIIRDVRGLERFATWEDVASLQDLDEVTEFYQAPRADPDVFTAVHTFDEPGWYIGIVTAQHPQLDRSYTAVFPFEVGASGPGKLAWLMALLVLAQLGYWGLSGQAGRWLGQWRARRRVLPADGPA